MLRLTILHEAHSGRATPMRRNERREPVTIAPEFSKEFTGLGIVPCTQSKSRVHGPSGRWFQFACALDS